jgi:hypothetical protein
MLAMSLSINATVLHVASRCITSHSLVERIPACN